MNSWIFMKSTAERRRRPNCHVSALWGGICTSVCLSTLYRSSSEHRSHAVLNMKAVMRLKPLMSIFGCYMMHYCMSCAEDKNTIKLTLMANWCFASVLWITWEAWYDLQTFCIFTIHNMYSSTGQCFTLGGFHCVVCPDCTNWRHTRPNFGRLAQYF